MALLADSHPIENWAEREQTAYETERGKPMPSKNHGYVQSRLSMILGYKYLSEYTLFSEITIEMPSRPNCVPDIAIYPKLQIDFIHDEISMVQMPLTAIEIVSPTQSNDEILAKFERYFFAGVQSYWLVMPSMKAISVYSQIGQYQFFTSDMTLVDSISDIKLTLSDIF